MRLWNALLPALLLLALVAVIPAAAASPPPTLDGETLTSPQYYGRIGTCTNSGSYSMSASGTATGPYPGTFTETFTGTVDSAAGLVTFSASFTIHSATGDVTGTKTYTPSSPSTCYQDSNNFDGGVPTTYQATIHTAQGDYTDQGSTLMLIFVSSGTVDKFIDTFTSSQTQTTLIPPADSTPPTTTATLSGTAGSNGWYRSNVQVTLAATDPDDAAANIATTYAVDGGAVTPYTTPFTVSGDGPHSVAFSSKDTAGNAEATQTQSFKIDATVPTAVVGTPDRGPDAGGYYNHPVIVTFTGQDATSGIATCTAAVTYSGPDSAAATVPGSCTDNAGNSTAAAFAFAYDTTAPVTTATPDRTANTNGWYNAPVKVTLSATDSLSGVAKSQYNLDTAGWTDYVPGTPVTISGDRVHTLLFHSVDKAGNAEANGTLTIKIDATAPTTTATPTGTAGANGWYTGNVSVALAGNDGANGSGVVKTEYNLDNTVWVTGVSVAVTTDGTHTVQYRSTDAAGNVEAAQSLTIKRDATKPTVTYTGNTGSYTLDQTVSITCTAADPTPGSGIASNTCKNITGPANTFKVGANTFSATATDAAGNTGSGTTSFTVTATNSGLVTLTFGFIEGSAKFKALPPAQQAQVKQLGTFLAQQVMAIQPTMTPAQKAQFVRAYTAGVNALAAQGWLTQAQATTLITLVKAL